MKRTLSDYSSLRAAEYNDSQINAAWLDTRQQSFREKLSLSALGSRYLLGAKGTGKTHLLRYFSLKVALKRNSYDLKISLNELGAISIYLRLPNDLSKFDHLGRDQGKIIFKVYFELLILRSTFDLIDNICSESNINDSAVCEVAEKYFNKTKNVIGDSTKSTPDNQIEIYANSMTTIIQSYLLNKSLLKI